MKYTEKFYTMGKAKGLGRKIVSLYVNPTLTELKKYIPEGARAFISEDGDLYVEGYEDLDPREENRSLITHGAILKIIEDKDPDFFHGINLLNVWGRNWVYNGITMQRNKDTNAFYFGEGEVEKSYDKEVIEKAREKNPNLILNPDISIKDVYLPDRPELKSIEDVKKISSARDLAYLKNKETEDAMVEQKSLPQKFIQEVFQEDGEGGGAPAASISANPTNLATGGGSTISAMAPQHMRFGVVTPFGNVSKKKKNKKKRKGWPY